MCQVRKEFQAKGARPAPYLNLVLELLSDIEYYTITHNTEENVNADSLAKMASPRDAQLRDLVPVEILSTSSIDHMDIDWILKVEPERESWITPMKSYLQRGILRDKRNEQHKLLHQASRCISYRSTL